MYGQRAHRDFGRGAPVDKQQWLKIAEQWLKLAKAVEQLEADS
jgi:hypothetical protein